MRKILKNKDGEAAIFAVILTLVLMLTFSVVSEYLRLQLIAKGIREVAQRAVISVATQNYDELYNGLREGYSGGYERKQGGGWESKLEEGAIEEEISRQLGLVNGNKTKEGVLEYTLSDIKVRIIHSPFAPVNPSDKFEAELTLKLSVPLSFGWGHLAPLKISLQVKAGYIPKF